MNKNNDLIIGKHKETDVKLRSSASSEPLDAPSNSLNLDFNGKTPSHSATGGLEFQKQPETGAAVPCDDKKTAKALHTAANFFGLHLIGNSALSLWITYNLAPLKQTQKVLHGLANVMTPVVEGWDKLKASVGLSKAASLSQEMRAALIKQSARSATETAVMCIAGSIILAPVMWWENNRPGIVNATDNFLHPEKKKKRAAEEAEAKKNGITLPPPAEEHEHKETLGNLIRARALALIPIFWIDGQIQGFNNSRIAAGKPNLDTFLWEKGAKIYDNMKPATRDGFINFFSSKGHNVESIQPLVREGLTKTVGTNASRMIAAEQFRMFSKEIYLTAIYTGFLYVLGKTPLIPWTLNKIGFTKKEEHHLENAVETDVGVNVLPFNDKPLPEETAAPSQQSFTSRIHPKSLLPVEPQGAYTQKLAAQELAGDAHMWDRSSL